MTAKFFVALMIILISVDVFLWNDRIVWVKYGVSNYEIVKTCVKKKKKSRSTTVQRRVTLTI
jgi:hypothetical protein